MAGNTDVIAADAVDLELEAMRVDDNSWHPCQVHFSPNGAAGLVIKYEDNDSEDVLESEKEAMIRIRARSLPLQDGECTQIKPGDHVAVISQNSQSENGFFDAEVEKVLKVRHSKRAKCRCSFMIKWLQQDLNDESLKVPSSSVMRLSNKSITNHPTISAFIDAEELNNSNFCLSQPLNVVSDFDMDLHLMLEKQIEGIKNSVHDSKKRFRDEILELDVNTHEQVKETSISKPNGKESKIQVPENRSPLNPLAARAALASLMSSGINDVSKITEIPLETEVTPKQDRTPKKSRLSKTKSSDNIEAEGKDKINPKSGNRGTRAKIQKVKGVVDDNNESSKKPSPVTNKRSTRSAVNHEAANVKTDTTKESSVDELPTRQTKKTRNNSSVASATQDSGGNVTSNGGRIYGSKKKSIDVDKQKVRSSPRFLSKK